MIDLRHGDCLEIVPLIESDSLDSIVTDPPAGISFMGKEWDHNKGGRDEWIKWMSEVMIEAKRTLKPGGHALVWALPRTSHWTGMALENAGFEVRDCVYHIFGSGFPKSLDIGKAIEKISVGTKKGIKTENGSQGYSYSKEYVAGKCMGGKQVGGDIPVYEINNEWEGWGTALKPAVECWWLVRKPLSDGGLDIAKNICYNIIKKGFISNQNILWRIKNVKNAEQLKTKLCSTQTHQQKMVVISAEVVEMKEKGSVGKKIQTLIENICENGEKEMLNGQDGLAINTTGQTKNELNNTGKQPNAKEKKSLSKNMEKNVSVAEKQSLSSLPLTTSEEGEENIEKKLKTKTSTLSLKKQDTQKTNIDYSVATATSQWVCMDIVLTIKIDFEGKEYDFDQLSDGSFVWNEKLAPYREPKKLNVAQNVLKHGTGGLAINECRVISDKIYNLLDYAKKIDEYVLSVSDENKSYKDHAHNEFSFHRNFDKLYSFSVDGAYHLADYEELNVQNPFYQKLLNFLGGCPVCFHLYDALVHLLSGIDLLTSQQLNDAHKYIHLFEQTDEKVVSPLHTHEKNNDRLSNSDCDSLIEDPLKSQIYYDKEYCAYAEYLELFRKSNHICCQDKQNQTRFPADILNKSSFLSLCRIYNSNELSCDLLKYIVILNITNTVHNIKTKILSSSRFPANVITDGSEEVVRMFPQAEGCKPHLINASQETEESNKEKGWGSISVPKNKFAGFDDAGSAARFFKVCEPDKNSACICYPFGLPLCKTDNKENRWKNILAHNAERSGWTTKAITEFIARVNVMVYHNEQFVQNVRCAGNLCEICGIFIAVALVGIKNSDFNQEELQVILDYIGNSKRCILIQNLVNFAELWGSIDTIPTIQNLSLLFGSVNLAIINSTRETEKIGLNRLIYTPKPSQSERNDGLEGEQGDYMDKGRKVGSAGGTNPRNRGAQNKRANHHPTVKAQALMNYLVKLITPKGGTVLDPFMGSGSTGVACRNLGMNFIGIEKELEYFEIAKKRIYSDMFAIAVGE